MENEKNGIAWKKIGHAIVETLKAIGYGDLLIRLRVDKSLPYIMNMLTMASRKAYMMYGRDLSTLSLISRSP